MAINSARLAMPVQVALLASTAIGSSVAPETYKIGTSGYAPYSFEVNDTWTGFAVEFAQQMSDMCTELTIEVVETPWYDCWRYDDTGIGDALENMTVDACLAYTHTHGIRNMFADFSWAILKTNKAAGLLGRLDANGMPLVSSDSDLAGLRVVDVGGWAPTPDTLVLTTNKCTDQGYNASDFTLSSSEAMDAVSSNDAALKTLLDGEADLVYIYSDQPKNIIDQCKAGEQDDKTNCTLWEGFGSTYAFVQTGKFGWVQNGTTLAMTKKGSGVDELLNPCIQQFMQSKEYYDLCAKYPSLLDDCYPNAHFPARDDDAAPYLLPTDELAAPRHCCSAGYCPCDQSAECGTRTTEKAPESSSAERPALAGARRRLGAVAVLGAFVSCFVA